MYNFPENKLCQKKEKKSINIPHASNFRNKIFIFTFGLPSPDVYFPEEPREGGQSTTKVSRC